MDPRTLNDPSAGPIHVHFVLLPGSLILDWAARPKRCAWPICACSQLAVRPCLCCTSSGPRPRRSSSVVRGHRWARALAFGTARPQLGGAGGATRRRDRRGHHRCPRAAALAARSAPAPGPAGAGHRVRRRRDRGTRRPAARPPRHHPPPPPGRTAARGARLRCGGQPRVRARRRGDQQRRRDHRHRPVALPHRFDLRASAGGPGGAGHGRRLAARPQRPRALAVSVPPQPPARRPAPRAGRREPAAPGRLVRSPHGRRGLRLAAPPHPAVSPACRHCAAAVPAPHPARRGRGRPAQRTQRDPGGTASPVSAPTPSCAAPGTSWAKRARPSERP